MKKSPQKAKPQTAPLPLDQAALETEISRRAYELWETGGHQPGSDAIHWFQAEREIQALRAPGPR